MTGAAFLAALLAPFVAGWLLAFLIDARNGRHVDPVGRILRTWLEPDAEADALVRPRRWRRRPAGPPTFRPILRSRETSAVTDAADAPPPPAVYATPADLKRLRAISLSRQAPGLGQELLRREVERMAIRADDDLRFVRLNSTVTYKDLRTRRRRIVQVVQPEHAHQDENRVSILSPIGAALIGLPEGSVFRWAERIDGATRAVKVLAVES